METKHVSNLVETSVMPNINSTLRLVVIAGAIAILTAACGAPTEKASRRSGLSPQSGDAVPNTDGGDDVVGQDPKADPKDPHKDLPKKDPPPSDDPQDIQKIPVATGLRNYEQINATMSAVTGIPRNTPAINTLFRNELSTALPTDNDVKAFIGSGQVAIYKLAVEYCDALVRDTTRRATFFPGFNFAGTPAVALNAAGKEAIADALITNVWGKDLESLPPHAESIDSVVSLIDELMVGKTTPAQTAAVVTGACTAVLASAPVTLF
jgi:hypothetical protein